MFDSGQKETPGSCIFLFGGSADREAPMSFLALRVPSKAPCEMVNDSPAVL